MKPSCELAASLTVVVVTLLLLTTSLGCDRTLKAPPRDLLGVWTTDAPAYQGRFIKFEDQYLLFGVGQGRSSPMQQISRIEVRQDGPRTVYTVHSEDAEGGHVIVLVYDPSNGGSLRIKNQGTVVWKKRAPAPEMSSEDSTS